MEKLSRKVRRLLRDTNDCLYVVGIAQNYRVVGVKGAELVIMNYNGSRSLLPLCSDAYEFINGLNGKTIA